MMRGARFSFAALVVLSVGSTARGQELDFGRLVETTLQELTTELFGIAGGLEEFPSPSQLPYRSPTQAAEDQLLLAVGLHAEFVTRSAAQGTQSLVPFPGDGATHLITCVGSPRQVIGSHPIGSPKLNPSVQRVDLRTGEVVTVLRGMDECGSVVATPWGTILATEAVADGGAYEILYPRHTREHTIVDRQKGLVVRPSGGASVRVARRKALPRLAWAGQEIVAGGVLFTADRLRPGTQLDDSDGGAIYKFVPERTRQEPIQSLAESPLVAGAVYALQVLCDQPAEQFGQGCGMGVARWISVGAQEARHEASEHGATGFDRPNAVLRDPGAIALPDGRQPSRVCWSLSGSSELPTSTQVVCAADSEAPDPGSKAFVDLFVTGDRGLKTFDDLAFNPRSYQLFLAESAANGAVAACLRDGRDRNSQSDGCLRLLAVRDSSASPGGLAFSHDGLSLYLAIKGSDDALMPLADGYRTDDIVRVTGFSPPDR